MWPEKDVPKDYLKLAKRLVNQETVTKREFIDLCKLAIKYVQSSDVSVRTRSDMAIYIANLWLNHKNIGSVSLLSEIGGQFGEWEIPGSFVIDDVRRPYWELILELVDEADKKYPPSENS